MIDKGEVVASASVGDALTMAADAVDGRVAAGGLVVGLE